MMDRLSIDELAAVKQLATTLGVARSVSEGLALCRHLLSTPVPEVLRDAIAGDRGARRRVAAACRRLATMGPDGDPFAKPGFLLGLDVNELGVRQEWRYRLAVLQRHSLSRVRRAGAGLGRSLTRPHRPA
jgi:hypothetical protein